MAVKNNLIEFPDTRMRRTVLTRDVVERHLRILSLRDATEKERLHAAKEFEVAAFEWHRSRLPRGSKTRPASAGIDSDCLGAVYRILAGASGETRNYLLRAVANIGDSGFVPVADRIAQNVDDATFSLIALALGQIGGPDAHQWLLKQKNSELASNRQVSVRMACQAVERGGIDDYAEGLVPTEVPDTRVSRPEPLRPASVRRAALFGGAVDKMQTTEYRAMVQNLDDRKNAPT
jgi:hypothetical protein